mmetsp:Transcript_13407/g.49816  ORF Transcript_13407/g.49816 Transcript_13407/m.49816 type:complete len:388 (-) Transcript_13407:292-1455(-)
MGNALRGDPRDVVVTMEEEKMVEELDVQIDDVLSHTDNNKEQRRRISMEDFRILKVLGRGSFGKVMLVRHNESGVVYAIKTLKKIALVKRNQLLHTQTERFVLQHVQHPFLMHLHFAWQTEKKLYMVLDFMAGGELFYWLKQHRRFSEQRTRLIVAEILLGLEALHEVDIIYRDLKPENILLDAEGHIRIADFGLAKQGVAGFGKDGGAASFCGTPEYLAPEILEQEGHGKAVDWWSLGTLMFEMMAGLPPFYDQNVQSMYRKIMKAPLRFPAHFSDAARSMCRGFLKRNPDERLGNEGGSAEIKRHSFFADVDWNMVYNKEYNPEFKPPCRMNFDPEFLAETPVDSIVYTTMTQSLREQAHFEGFTYDGSAGSMLGADDAGDSDLE